MTPIRFVLQVKLENGIAEPESMNSEASWACDISEIKNICMNEMLWIFEISISYTKMQFS